jgi:DNA-binding transcriptional ArsR family regulator
VSTTDTFRALADPTRREILRLLRGRAMTAGELAEHFALAKSTLSGHFNVLRHAGLVVMERQSTRIVYSLSLSALEEAMSVVFELVKAPAKNKTTRRSRMKNRSAILNAV